MRWGLIGASTIASEHVIGTIRAREGYDVKAVLSSDHVRGAKYAARHDIPESIADLYARLADHDLYAWSLGLFSKAAAGAGRPAADGIDGIKSLAVALAFARLRGSDEP